MFALPRLFINYNKRVQVFKLWHRCCSVNSVNRIPFSTTMANNLILYGDEASPPVRFVMITAAVVDIKLHFHKVDLFLGENNAESYKKINPLRKVPALAVGSDILRDSHAIAIFLCRQSISQDLYPQDSLKRARVEEILFFNSSALFPVDSEIFTDFFAGIWPVNKKKVEQWHFLLDYLDSRLRNDSWLVGEKMTLADICCGSTISSLQLLLPPLERHIKLNKWMLKLQAQPCFQSINSKGLERMKSFVDKMLYSGTL